VKGLFKQQTLKGPKVAQLDKVLLKWFTAMRSEGEPMIGPVIIEKANYSCDAMKKKLTSAHSLRTVTKDYL
jgi:hypothetical protein